MPVLHDFVKFQAPCSPGPHQAMIIQVLNESELAFQLDGDWWKAGDFKSDKSALIPPKSETTVEIAPSTVEGIYGVAWWVDASGHNVYLSMAISKPRLGTNRFSCSAGLPPPNLKTSLSSAPKLEPAESSFPGQGAGCEWAGTSEGVRVRIFPELDEFAPLTAADLSPKDGDADEPQEETQSEASALATTGGSYPRTEGGDFMALTRPKDGADGLVRGLKTAGAGVAGGLVTAVAAPVHGARSGGAAGFVKGLGAGVLGGAAMVVGGVGCGVAQVGRGLMQAPKAARARREEKVWDQELGCWVDVDLCALERQVVQDADKDATSSPGGSAGASGGGQVADTEYYDLLRVQQGRKAEERKATRAVEAMNRMNACETNIYETCGANGQSESSDSSVSGSSGSEGEDNEEIPHQSSVMAIVRERLRTAHGLEHTESDQFIWSTEVYEEELPLAKRRNCKLPLRFVISSLIIIAILASSCTMYAYLMVQWSRAHGETLNLFKEADLKIFPNVSLAVFFKGFLASLHDGFQGRDSLQEQGRRLELQILDSSRLAYDKLLLNIEWTECGPSGGRKSESTESAVGWNEWTDLLAEAARTQLRDQWEENTGEHALQQVIRDRLQGFAYSLVIAYCTGLYAGASITLDGNKSYTFKTRPPVLPGLPGPNLSLSVFSHESGESHLERTLEFQPTSRPYYLVQKELFEKGASQQQSSSDAWTGVFNYTIPWKPMTSECGYAKSLPIPFCNGLSEGVGSACDGFCGAIASHVSLETMKEALQVQWKRIHDYLASPLYNYELLASKSSVFTLIQKSNAAPYQEGFLLAASNDPEQGCNFRYANDSPLHIVSSAARALHRRMGGSWNAELLHSRFMMNFSMAEIELGRSVPCQSLTKDCFDAATLQIKLDDDLHWLVVLVLPADAFTLTAASQQSAWESFLHKE
eukprot:s851_g9.t1